MPANPNIEKEMEELNARVSAVEHKMARMTEAFVTNDLGVPDYDGHRRDHFTRREQDTVIKGYQRGVTVQALWATLAGTAVLIGQALMEWLRNHIK